MSAPTDTLLFHSAAPLPHSGTTSAAVTLGVNHSSKGGVFLRWQKHLRFAQTHCDQGLEGLVFLKNIKVLRVFCSFREHEASTTKGEKRGGAKLILLQVY